MDQNKKKKIYVTGLLSLLLLVGFDQLTKYLAIIKLQNQKSFVILDGIFELQYLENRGAAFGMMQGKRILFMVITIVVSVMLSYAYVKIPCEKRFNFMRLIILLFLSGAIGNFIDRTCRNYVVDFFYFKLIDFPIFNIADIYVTVGMLLTLLAMFAIYNEKDFETMQQAVQFWKK